MLTEAQLKEAEVILRKRKCKSDGHAFDVEVKPLSTIPTGIRCLRCDEYWRVFSPVESPTVAVRPIELDAPTQIMTKWHGH